jgi:hypothetical protein
LKTKEEKMERKQVIVGFVNCGIPRDSIIYSHHRRCQAAEFSWGGGSRWVLNIKVMSPLSCQRLKSIVFSIAVKMSVELILIIIFSGQTHKYVAYHDDIRKENSKHLLFKKMIIFSMITCHDI